MDAVLDETNVKHVSKNHAVPILLCVKDSISSSDKSNSVLLWKQGSMYRLPTNFDNTID